MPGRPPGSAGPAGTNPALVRTFWDATLSWVVAALSVRSPYCPAATRDLLRNPVPEHGRAVFKIVEVEPAEYRAILANEHVEDAGASLLLGQGGVVLLSEVVVELIAAVGDKGGEVGAVRQFEGQDHRGMISAQTLQLGHRPTLLSSSGVPVTCPMERQTKDNHGHRGQEPSPNRPASRAGL